MNSGNHYDWDGVPPDGWDEDDSDLRYLRAMLTENERSVADIALDEAIEEAALRRAEAREAR